MPSEQHRDGPGKDEQAYALLHDDDSTAEAQIPYGKTSRPRRKLFLVISHVVIALIALVIGASWKQHASTSLYSPILKDVGLKYHTVKFNGSLLQETIYRNDASPEVDAAWEALGLNYRSVQVPPEIAAQSGLSHDQVRVNSKYGGGYPANVEGLHHLHCLNLLRQSSWYNFEYYHKKGEGAFKNTDDILKKHVTHCLDTLRQQLMCVVDVGMLGQVWWDPQSPKAFVDFNTKHRCRNFEDIRKWAEVRQMPEEPPDDWLAPPDPGQYIFPAVP